MPTDKVLIEAYRTLCGHSPDQEMEDWQLVPEILNRWNVPKLGENFAREIIFEIVLHTQFPDENANMEITKAYVHDAEQKGVELFPEIGDRDPSMDLYAVIEQEYWENKRRENGHELKNSMK